MNVADADLLEPPFNIHVTSIADNSVHLSWSPPCDNGNSDIIRYDVEQSDSLHIDWKPGETVATPTCSAAITGLDWIV